MPLRKARKENRSSPVSQVYCTTSWADVLAMPPSKDIGMSKHLAARLCPHRGLGTFCVPTNHSLLSKDAVERPSDNVEDGRNEGPLVRGTLLELHLLPQGLAGEVGSPLQFCSEDLLGETNILSQLTGVENVSQLLL